MFKFYEGQSSKTPLSRVLHSLAQNRVARLIMVWSNNLIEIIPPLVLLLLPRSSLICKHSMYSLIVFQVTLMLGGNYGGINLLSIYLTVFSYWNREVMFNTLFYFGGIQMMIYLGKRISKRFDHSFVLGYTPFSRGLEYVYALKYKTKTKEIIKFNDKRRFYFGIWGDRRGGYVQDLMGGGRIGGTVLEGVLRGEGAGEGWIERDGEVIDFWRRGE